MRPRSELWQCLVIRYCRIYLETILLYTVPLSTLSPFQSLIVTHSFHWRLLTRAFHSIALHSVSLHSVSLHSDCSSQTNQVLNWSSSRLATSRPVLCRQCFATRNEVVRRAAREEVVSDHLQEFKSDWQIWLAYVTSSQLGRLNMC